jgi:hypothetical protein
MQRQLKKENAPRDFSGRGMQSLSDFHNLVGYSCEYGRIAGRNTGRMNLFLAG